MEEFNGFCGFKLVTEKDGVGVFTAEVRPEHRNIHGTVHGGVLFTLLDSAAGAAGRSVQPEGKSVMTRCSSVHYLRPVVSGTMTARAEIVKAGKSMVLVSARLSDEDEKLCATGEFEMFVIDKKG